MRPSGLITTAALSVYLLGAGVAHANAQWSTPTTVTSGSYQLCCRPSALVFTGDGHALATLGGSKGASVLAAAPGTSAFTQIRRARIVDEPAVYGRRGIAYLQTLPQPPGTKIARLGTRLGAMQGSLGRFQQLALVDVSNSGAIEARIAADPRGNVAVAWLAPSGKRLMVQIALRRPRHAFGSPTTLGEAASSVGEGADPLSVAYGASGDLVVTFQRSTTRSVSHKTLRLAVRVKRPGARFGAVQTLGPTLGDTSIETAVAAKGSAVVAWGTQDGGEGVEEPWQVRAAMLHAGARRFSKTQLLDPGRVGYPVAGVSSAISPGGTATVAWSGVYGGQPYPVRVATASSAGRFGATQQLTPNGETMGLTTAPDGSTTVLWGSLEPGRYAQDDPYPDQIFTSHRPAGSGAFGVPEPVSPRLPAGVAGGRLAIDPRTARPAALWTSGPYGADIQTVLYSTRAG